MWILGIRNALRSIKNQCVTCRKGRAQTIAPVMADLPEERLDASTALANVGVDYFGTFIVKIGRRNKKRRCCLFTCLTMRAALIEVVPKLDTDSCLKAIKRFIAQGGKPNLIISDNRTNFVAAEREFAESQMEVQPTRSTSLWWSMGTVGEKLQESNVCIVAEQISHRGRSFKNDV